MTLTIHKEEDEQRQLALTIEVEEKRVEQAMRKTARKLAGNLHVPGFRRGKAPYNVILRRFGRDAVRAEAVEEMIQPIFEEALDQLEEPPYAQANFDDMEMEPLVLKFTIPLAPKVTLGNYRELRREIEPVVVTDEALADALERVQIRHQVLEPVERAIELSDLVTLSGVGELVVDEAEETEAEEERETDDIEDAETAESEELTEDDTEDDTEDNTDHLIFSEDRIDFVMDSTKVFPGTPFVENLVGLSSGDEHTFRFTFPDDYEDEELAGKEAEFEIEILNVQSRELPELTDELAKEEGGYETVDELRTGLKEQLHTQAESAAKNRLVEEMIDDLLKETEMVYPPAAVESEIDSMVENFKGQAQRTGWEWEDFLRLQGKTEEDMREDFRESATEQLKRQLALRQFVLDEKLTVQAGDVDTYVEDRVAAFGDNKELQESMRNYYRSGYGFDMISSEILMEKAHQRIEAILTGNAPDLDALDEEEMSESATEEE